jgi:hypothetical protein
VGNAKLVVQERQDRAQPVKAVGVDAERPISEDGGSVAYESLVVGCVTEKVSPYVVPRVNVAR